MTLAAYTGVYVVLSTSGLLVLRRSLPKISGGSEGIMADLARHPEVIAGGALYALSFVTFLLALRRFNLTTVYPVFVGSGYVAVALGSWLLLDEHISLSRGVGIAAIGLGLVLVVR
jgi:multidrug transporter EmrE-like cation transporter